jgi:hypothetical protein
MVFRRCGSQPHVLGRPASAGPHPLPPSPKAGRGGEGGTEDWADRGSAATRSAYGAMMVFVGYEQRLRSDDVFFRCGSQPHVLGRPASAGPHPLPPSPKAGRGGEGGTEDWANRGSAATSSAYGVMMVFRRCGSQPHVLGRPQNRGKSKEVLTPRPLPSGFLKVRTLREGVIELRNLSA